ncbi:hypothetical protein BAUCODRAFT_121189 [Baudoinia panamericana UAMH 10762]|uniref:F-box domain-containing protein n=1 Tax=Baudoinia panamericana (strain UAMH 10762) TaxID=717646 RepID=M2LUN9_BAUPA|nr:uncharacterized protein BAUCODRAFT_121189 [Baudoinia panamericana UAMH 10762]EMC98312.1 hypothetical protein BAUCODRAFT_121189 [Baudoinia panamericana UAMH 10762]
MKTDIARNAFERLPKEVRVRIYELHLVHEEPLTDEKHKLMVGLDESRYASFGDIPPLLTLSSEVEKEGAPFYYSRNHFVGGNGLFNYSFNHFMYCTPRQHLTLFRKVTVQWDETTHGAYYMFQRLRAFTGLEALYIRVDERAMVKRMLRRKDVPCQAFGRDPSPQQQLQLLQYPGLSGLLELSGIPHVEFVKKVNAKGEESGGPIAGGFLETQIAPRLMKLKVKTCGRHKKAKAATGFPFLNLSPEIRNRVYEMVLRVDGAVQPIKGVPTSAARTKAYRDDGVYSDSSLSLLVVNRQIHNEAVGIFYHHNEFEFQYTLRLNAFLLSLGPERLNSLRDITVHTYEFKNGGLSLTELTFSMFKRLKALRKLHVILQGDLFRKIVKWPYRNGWSMCSANPATAPGIKTLFNLRGLTTILVTDEELTRGLDDVKKDPSYPTFAVASKSQCIVRVSKALDHLNAALLDAQSGRVNHKLLEDEKWQCKDDFPTIDQIPAEDVSPDGDSRKQYDSDGDPLDADEDPFDEDYRP